MTEEKQLCPYCDSEVSAFQDAGDYKRFTCSQCGKEFAVFENIETANALADKNRQKHEDAFKARLRDTVTEVVKGKK